MNERDDDEVDEEVDDELIASPPMEPEPSFVSKLYSAFEFSIHKYAFIGLLLLVYAPITYFWGASTLLHGFQLTVMVLLIAATFLGVGWVRKKIQHDEMPLLDRFEKFLFMVLFFLALGWESWSHYENQRLAALAAQAAADRAKRKAIEESPSYKAGLEAVKRITERKQNAQ